MENGCFANVWFVGSRNWFMIHESETPNSNSALYHTFTLFYAAHWPTSSDIIEGTISPSSSDQLCFTYFDPKFTGGLLMRLGPKSQLNQEPFDISCNTLSHKATYSKSVSSQLWWTETITYELHEYGTTQEFTSWIFRSINIQFA